MNPDPWRLEMKLKSPEMLRQYMQFKGMKIRELAMMSGVSRATIGHLHSGHRKTASPRTAKKIESALGCPPGLLFEALSSKVSRVGAA